VIYIEPTAASFWITYRCNTYPFTQLTETFCISR